MIDMSGWASVGSCACGSRSCRWCGGIHVDGDGVQMTRVLTDEEVRGLLEEGRRIHEHYQREIRKMRNLTHRFTLERREVLP